MLAAAGVIAISMFGYWLFLACSHGNALRSAYTQLEEGMSDEDVMRMMENDAPVRYHKTAATDVLSSDASDKCEYTLVFRNPYYLDPQIYCFFDSNDNLLGAHCFE